MHQGFRGAAIKIKSIESANEALVMLYRAAQEQPIQNFQATVLGQLKALLSFDAAIWGAGSMTNRGIDIHSFHLHDKTPDMVCAYEEVKHLDCASAEMLQKPCHTKAFNTAAFFDEAATRPIRDFMLKFEQPNFLLSTDLNDRSSSLHWLTLYRTNADAHFSAIDVKRLHMVAPHLKQALELNLAVHLGKVVNRFAGLSKLSTAIADLKGMIHAHDDQFMTVLGNTCGQALNSSNRLPPDLVTKLQAGETVFSWRQLIVQCHAEHDLIVIKLRAQTLADSLTEREKMIALLVSKGFTYKEVAAQVSRSPSTIRNQIQMIYAKLQVNNIAELVHAISELR